MGNITGAERRRRHRCRASTGDRGGHERLGGKTDSLWCRLVGRRRCRALGTEARVAGPRSGRGRGSAGAVEREERVSAWCSTGAIVFYIILCNVSIAFSYSFEAHRSLRSMSFGGEEGDYYLLLLREQLRPSLFHQQLQQTPSKWPSTTTQEEKWPKPR
jgi:hypothetical protein